jgi:hypothetical protein
MEDLVERYYHINKKIKEYEDEQNEIREKIHEEMSDSNKTKLDVGEFQVERRKMKMERMNKSTCPSEIWEKYCTENHFWSLYIRKKGEKRSRSRSRSPPKNRIR